MTESNILILSAGRRVELVESFKNATSIIDGETKVFTTDMNPQLSPACQVSDRYFTAPRVTEIGYKKYLINLCEKNSIGLLIPTIDTELLLLSECREEFEGFGIHIVISQAYLVKQCRDKRKTAELFAQLEIEQPIIYQKDDIKFPCFCKPYDGSCSIGAMTVKNRDYLTKELLANEKNMFMELIGQEYCEITVDAYYNIDGELCCLVPRERIEVRAGEVSKGATRRNYVYDYLLERLVNLKGARGCITVQVFYNPDTESVKGLEINPRFGGGFPLSDAVGAKYPEWILREYILNEKIKFFDAWESDVIMLRYDAKVLVRG